MNLITAKKPINLSPADPIIVTNPPCRKCLSLNPISQYLRQCLIRFWCTCYRTVINITRKYSFNQSSHVKYSIHLTIGDRDFRTRPGRKRSGRTSAAPNHEPHMWEGHNKLATSLFSAHRKADRRCSWHRLYCSVLFSSVTLCYVKPDWMLVGLLLCWLEIRLGRWIVQQPDSSGVGVKCGMMALFREQNRWIKNLTGCNNCL